MEAQLPQGTIQYRESGTGEPLVFIHGLLANGRLWDKVAELLSPDFRCIVPEWPMGSHPAPMNPDADLTPPGFARLVDDFMASLELDGVTLVGNDSGGAISQIVATKHPERLARLVLTNCDLYEDFPPKLFAYLKPTARIPGAMAAVAQTMRIKPLRRSSLAYGVLAKHRIEDDVLESWVRPGLENPDIRRDTRKLILGIDPEYTLEAARELGRFEKPTLFAWAPEDRWFKIDYAERLAASMPDARVERIPDSKTFVALDQPERLAEAIRAFVREPASAAA